jgi:hypothetical protein
VRGHFEREQALSWDRGIVGYVEGNGFFENYRGPGDDFFGSVGSRPEITVIGTVPDQDLAASLVRRLVPRAVGGWTTDDSVTVSTSTGTAGATRLHVLHNWSWDEAVASVAAPVTDLLTGARHPAGETITLRAWDVKLLRSDEFR